MRRDRPAPEQPITGTPQAQPPAAAMQPGFATAIAHLGLAAEAAVDEARQARFLAAQHARDAARTSPLRRLLARLRPAR